MIFVKDLATTTMHIPCTLEKPVKFKFNHFPFKDFSQILYTSLLLAFNSGKVFVGFKEVSFKQRKEERHGDICSHFSLISSLLYRFQQWQPKYNNY